LKKRAVIVASSVLAASVAVLVLAAQRSSPAEIEVRRDLVFATVAGADLKLDLAMPKAAKGLSPAVVFLHGGGWRAGKRQEMNHFVEGMARLGYVGVASDYRLVPGARFPAQVEDSKAAIRWLRAHAAEYGVRADRIGVVGFSAGGHLAAMLGVTGDRAGVDGTGGNTEPSSRVQAVVSFFGPTDFSTRDWPADFQRGVIVPFLGGSLADRPDAYREASPINHASAQAPPFLLFHGTDDKLVPIDQSRRLADRLIRLGAPARVVAFEGEGHAFSDATNQKAMQQMLDFLAEQLKK
jgi:acetyl esterase/lipase